jgi:pimeloyl-ACP methyl ester carboxylesterase
VVGHSAGGLYARLFAARRRREIVGLVFVDTSVEHQPQRLAALFGPGAGSIEGIRQRPARCLELTRAPQPEKGEALLDCAPSALDPQARRIALRPETWRTQVSELDALFTTTSDETDRVGGLLQDVPAIVLTAAKGDGLATGPDDPGGATWQRFQGELAASFRQADRRLVKSSHMMMFDRPEVVVQAVSRLVAQARRR